MKIEIDPRKVKSDEKTLLDLNDGDTFTFEKEELEDVYILTTTHTSSVLKKINFKKFGVIVSLEDGSIMHKPLTTKVYNINKHKVTL